MRYVRQLFIGIIIGGGMILPGISGSVLAVIFNIYDELLDSVLNFFKDIKKHFLFLGPLLLGLIIGVFLFGKILFFFFNKYPIETNYVFMGLILGCLPVLFKEIEKKGSQKVNVPVLIISFVIALSLFVLGKGTFDLDFSSNIDKGLISFVLLFLTGCLFAAGKVIPGISSSFLLMLIGMYQYLLNILNNPLSLTREQYLELIPIGLGFIIGGLWLMKLMQSILRKYFTITYSAIIGFIIGSIAAIYPGFDFNSNSYVGIVLLIVSFLIVYKLTLTSYKEIKDNKSIDK